MQPAFAQQYLDDIVKARVHKERDEFIASISKDQICKLASSYHGSEPCYHFTEPERGSYNICFFVAFDNEDKWVIRVPLTPCLGFEVKDKIESEVATMQLLSERTDIPIAKIVAHQSGESSEPLSSFLILEYMQGQSLWNFRSSQLSSTQQEKLYTSLARIYIQLRRLEFPSIGRLECDEAGFKVSKMAMSLDINAQTVEGLNPHIIQTAYYGNQNTLKSANAYTTMLLDIADNAFATSRGSVTTNEYEGADALYHAHLFRRHAEQWLDRSLDQGPFVLIHGDFQPQNILVNEEMDITCVLDWEWSRVVPQQFFEPPLWLTFDTPPTLAFASVYKVEFLKSFDKFLAITRRLEREMYGNELLSNEWEMAKSDSGFLVANALENWTDIDWFACRYLGRKNYTRENLKEQVWSFMNEDPSRGNLVKRKLEEGIAFMNELKKLQE